MLRWLRVSWNSFLVFCMKVSAHGHTRSSSTSAKLVSGVATARKQACLTAWQLLMHRLLRTRPVLVRSAQLVLLQLCAGKYRLLTKLDERIWPRDSIHLAAI
jgi:hypothetical protein